LEIQFAPHLEILCWFRLVEGRRGLNTLNSSKIRIERGNAACGLQASIVAHLHGLFAGTIDTRGRRIRTIF